MTLRERDPVEMPANVRAIGEQVLQDGDPYRVIGEQLADLVRDEQFAALYEPTGRAAVWPSVLALVTADPAWVDRTVPLPYRTTYLERRSD